jgi:DNA helicase-2/ATP-dependent DNA helicase PcrA
VEDKNGLNQAQKEAVAHAGGPLLIVAGAGAGKTKTITHRIARLIERGTPAHRILGLTFTNKAAGEMRERVLGLIPKGRGAPLLTTFHSLGARLLREFHKEAGVPERFSIWDRDDSTRALKKILGTLGNESTPPRAILAALSRHKGEGTSAKEYAEHAHSFRERAIARAWEEYDKRLEEEDALDFDDLLLKTLALLRNSPDTLARLRERFHYITIDEYQDTNRVQYEIARLLAEPRNNICVVGDIDQNIYSWRGADIAHLLAFEKTFPQTKVVVLEQNYRSTRTILAAANAVIEKNMRRTPKNLFTENGTGAPITFYGAHNETDEAWFVAQSALQLIETGTTASEIAVLYRENFQSRALEEAFLHVSVPYRVVGTRFFERKEVKDLLSYLRASLNPKSRSDLGRIIATPPRGIGPSTLAKMLEGNDAMLPPAAQKKVAAFRELLRHIAHASATLPASETVRYVLEASGMEDMFSARGGHALGGRKDNDENRERLENVHELVNVATRYDFEKPLEGIEKLLEEAALQSDQDELNKNIPAVSLMTVHASKGLEFDAVFITGLEQGLFPSTREDDTPADGRDPEEERRLFYVALTRARERIFLSYARERMKYGSREYALPSEFLEDIDPRPVQYAEPQREHEEETIR